MSKHWRSLAEPQLDGCDTAVFLEQAEHNRRIVRYRPPSRGSGRRRYFDGRVACVTDDSVRRFTGLNAARCNAAAIAEAEQLIARCWPPVHRQFGRLISHLCPMKQIHPQGGLHSSSGSFEDQFGLIYATVEHPITLAEALVHELAHHKLFALGVGIEECNALILNSPDKRYRSPVILDRKRPMTAVLHAQYSFIHILQLDLLLLERARNASEAQTLTQLVEYTLPKMQKGLREIQKNIQLDARGELFMGGFYPWCERVIEQAQLSLEARAA